jgi:hypothetical protein
MADKPKQPSDLNKLKDTIFSLPSILSLAEFSVNAIAAKSAYDFQEAEAKRATAESRRQFWTEYANVNQQNYRNYELQLDAWYRESDYVEKRRQYEEMLAEQQAVYKGQVATAATKNFERQLADLEGRFYEEEAKDTIELESIRAQAIASKAKAASSGQAGRTVERLQQQYNQQYLANVSNRQITRNFRLNDKIRTAEAANIARENTTNQVQYYNPQPFADPVKPLAPLPIKAVQPSQVSGPSRSALTMQIAQAGFNAFQSYQDMLPPKPKEIQSRSFYSSAKPSANFAEINSTTETFTNPALQIYQP